MMKKSKFSLDISSLVRKFCADNFEKKLVEALVTILEVKHP